MNGGLEPVITLKGDKWQRWRILYAGIKGFFVLRIVDENTGQPAPQCELQLYAKDGVYLMNLPRPVTAMLLASASRAEVLVRCTNVKAGQKFTLTARCVRLVGWGM
jgi:FtsP/CotA-like multicopper oxidase with cupredoxin domain